MKKFLILFLLLTNAIAFSQKTKNTKTKSKPNVPLIKEDSKTKVPILTDADDDLLPISSNEPSESDLLDVIPSKPIILKPNAGQNYHEMIGINGDFTFNKKIGFMASSSEGDWVGHTYLNSKNGFSFLPHESLSNLTKPEGKMDQIMTQFAEFYTYAKTSEGNYCMKMGNDYSAPNHDWISQMDSKKFFSSFKKTGKVVRTGGKNQFKSVEYKGKDDEGKTIFVYLATSSDIRIDTKKTHVITGFFGLGYMASPSKRTYLVTGIKGSEGSIFMTYIENASTSFSGKGYKPMGEMMAQAMANNKDYNNFEADYESINNESDPNTKAAKLKALEEYKKMVKNIENSATKFSQSNDIQDIAAMTNNPEYFKNYYDVMILGYKSSIEDMNNEIKELQKYPDENTSQKINQLNCKKGCANAEISRITKLRDAHLEAFKIKDDDKRETKMNQIMEIHGVPNVCNCY